MKARYTTTVLAASLLAWLAIVVALFLAVSQIDFLHQFVLWSDLPWRELAERISAGHYAVEMLLALLGALTFSVACLSLGLLVLRQWGKTEANYVALTTSAFVTGEVIFSLVFLTCIVIYLLTPQTVAVLIAAGLLIGLQRLFRFLSARRQGAFLRGLDKADRVGLALALAVLALAVLYSASRLSYDAVVQYFSQAKIMAVVHTAVHTYPKDPFLVSSFHPGILYTALIQLFGDQAARMLTWINGIAILLLGLAIGEEAGLTPRARMWFLALMATSTMFVDLLGDGKVEIISTAALLAGIYWVLRSARAPSESTFALIGFLIGFAMIARPYNIFLAPLFLVVFYTIHLVYASRAGGFDFRKFTIMALWMLPSLCAMGAFHLLQNWLWLGNPIAPLVEGRHLSASAWQWQFDPSLLNVYRLLYPLAATFVNSPQSLGNISPFFIGFLPFLAFGRVREGLRERPVLLKLTLAAVITLALWVGMFFTVVELRYVLFLWVLLFLFVAQVMDNIAERLGTPMRVVIGAVVWLLLVYMGARTTVIALGTYSPIDAQGQAHCYDIDFCTFLDPLNQAAKSGERVFVLNAYRYYLRPDLFACSSRAQEYAQLESLAMKKSPDFWTELYRQGFRYVTYENNYAVFHSHFGSLPAVQGVPDWLHVSQASSTPDGLEKIYKIEAVNPPIQPTSYCERDAAGIWQIRWGTPPNGIGQVRP